MKASEQPSPNNAHPGKDAFLARPAVPPDIPAIRAIERALPSAAHWPETVYNEVFAPESSTRIAIVIEEECRSPRGFVIARLTSGECELENIAVAPNLQRRGAGTQLIQSLIAAARDRDVRSIFLEVRESNNSARGLYEKCGFRVTGRRPKYYSDPEEDAVLYCVPL